MGPEEHGLVDALQGQVLRDDVEVVSVFRVNVSEHHGELGPHAALLVERLEGEPGAGMTAMKNVAFCYPRKNFQL